MLPFYRWPAVFAVLLLLAGSQAVAQPAEAPSGSALRAQLGRLSPFQQDEVLWLARCIYSESDRGHEQRLVAWVVRNRAETDYRGTNYREVVLEPRQFSAFNEPSIRRNHILSLTPHSLSKAWRRALAIALDVYQAPASKRPFPIATRHFYSPVSMKGGRTPRWAKNVEPLSNVRLGVDPHRFRFFAGIDEGAEEPVQTVNTPDTSVLASGRTLQRSPKRRSTRTRRFSGRVKRPVRPHLDRRGQK